MTAQRSYQGPVFDVHAHHVPAWFAERVGRAVSFSGISDLEAAAEGARDGHGSKRVLSASLEILYGSDRAADPDQLRRVNATLAEAVGRHPDALLALASVDPYGGDGAEQIRYAAEELGLVGITVDSDRGGIVFGQPETEEAIAAAAELGMPILVHPVWAAEVEHVRATAGLKAASWGRGYRNGLALLQLLESGVLERYPDLAVIFTALGTGSLFMAHEKLASLRSGDGVAPPVYLDTTSLHVPSIRYAVEVLGADRVLAGTDWPIHGHGSDDIAVAVEALELDPLATAAILAANFTTIFRRATRTAPTPSAG